MGREGWLYGAAFLVVLALGAFLIVPRLQRLRASRPDPETAPAGAPSRGPEPSVPEPPPVAVPVAAEPWVELEVRGAQGALTDLLHPVVGADVEASAIAPETRIRVRRHGGAGEVAFGAPGHVWKRVAAADLVAGRSVRLEAAAKAILLRVVESDGHPAAGVPLLLEPAPPGPAPRTGTDGTVVLDFLPPGLVRVRVGATERAGPSLTLVAGREERREARLDPAWIVTGRLVDAAGEPVVGASAIGVGRGVLLGSGRSTDAEGRFSWIGPVVPTLSLRLEAPGWAPVSFEVRPPARGSLRTDVGNRRVLTKGASLTGTIHGAPADGGVDVRVEPAAAAVLRELFGSAAVLDVARTATVEPDGTYFVTGLPTGVPLRIAVRGAGLPVDEIARATPGETLARDVTPPPGHTLEGRVLDVVAGRPAAGLRLLVSRSPADGEPAGPADRTVVTDVAGRFRLTGLARGPVYLRAYRPDRAALLAAVDLPRVGALRLTLDPRRAAREERLRGVVIDDRAEPLAGVRVRAAGRSTLTDAEGSFQLDDVRGVGAGVRIQAGYDSGPMADGVDPAGFVPGIQRDDVLPGGPPLQLVLPRQSGLRFRALDGMNDVPLSFVYVLVRDEGGRILFDRTVATRDGRVELEGLVPGGATLTLYCDRHRLVLPLEIEPAVVGDLGDLRLSRGMHVEGRVLDVDGEPIAGARLAGMESGWLRTRSSDPTELREMDLRRTVSGPDGRFVIDGFDPKRPATVAVWAPGYAPAARRIVLEAFSDDVRTELDVHLRTGGFLAIDLIEAGTERRVSGALFDLEDARNGSDYLDLVRRGVLQGPAGCDEDWKQASIHFLPETDEGRYRVGPVEPGPYEVWVDRPGYRSLRRKLSVLDPTDEVLTGGAHRRLTEAVTLTWQMTPR